MDATPTGDGITITDEGVDTRSGRFVAVVGGVEAELVYRLVDDRLVLVHTGVPDELGGKGVGGALVQHAVGVAEADGLTIVPSCPFARSWLERHPDAAGRVTVDWR